MVEDSWRVEDNRQYDDQQGETLTTNIASTDTVIENNDTKVESISETKDFSQSQWIGWCRQDPGVKVTEAIGLKDVLIRTMSISSWSREHAQTHSSTTS